MTIVDGLFGLSLSVLVGAIITAFRLWSKDQRQKGELAIRMLIEWANQADRTMDQCVSLADKDNLEAHEVNMIWRRKSCAVSVVGKPGLKDTLVDLFGEEDLSEDSGSLMLSETQVKYVEYHWSTYLNRLEFMLAAWVNNLVNKKIMSNQLETYLSIRKDQLKLLMTNEVSDCFPTVRSFQKGNRPSKNLSWFQTGPFSR